MERKSLTYLKLGIVFIFFQFKINQFDLLPDFVGMLLLFASIQSHAIRTEAEERVKPLFPVLAADSFLHFVFHFEIGLENLLMTVISIYALFVLLREVAERIRTEQPDRAGRLEIVNVATVVVQTVTFLVSAYDNEALNGMIIVVMLGLMTALLVAVCGIKPLQEN